MKKDILDRYDIDENGEFIISIFARNVEELYNNFDKESSFLKKDLNEELVEYLIESVKELENEKFVIKFYFKEKIDKESQQRIQNSIKRFFKYMQELEKEKMSQQIKNAFIFMIIGIFFTALSIGFGERESIVQKVLLEGLMVAGWVSLWEALATFLIKWLPLTKKLKLFKKISSANLKFEQ